MKKILGITLSCLIGVFLFSFSTLGERYFEIAKNLKIFSSVFKEVNNLYIDDVSPLKLIHHGIDSMLNSLDPYTNYISEDQVENFKTLNTGQYGGIGALTRIIDNRIVIAMVYKDYPAYKNGLQIGDVILKIDAVELAKLSPEEANQLMRGQIGTTVKLTVQRYGQSNPIELAFKREKIKIKNVPYYGLLTPTIGYIQLTEFTNEAGKEVKNAVLSLKEKEIKNIILDLRGNPGGLLLEAVNICNLFVPKGTKIVDTKGKLQEHNVTYETLNPPIDLDIPVVVLINQNSASAAEIVAGTLQDYDRAVIIGEKSFGKGLVQLSRPLPYHAQIKITTAKYYTPTGRCIQSLDYVHRKEDGSAGIVPDSLKKQFLTTQGRKVYDGGGIDPDIKIVSPEYPPVLEFLHNDGFIFNYATRYAATHTSISSAKKFSLTDTEYADFIQWMKNQNYTYQLPAESKLKNIMELAKNEKYYTPLQASLDKLQIKLKESKRNDLVVHRDEIKIFLEEEIMSRFYLEKGVYESRFKYDLEIKKAVDILEQPTEYKRILNRL